MEEVRVKFVPMSYFNWLGPTKNGYLPSGAKMLHLKGSWWRVLSEGLDDVEDKLHDKVSTLSSGVV